MQPVLKLHASVINILSIDNCRCPIAIKILHYRAIFIYMLLKICNFFHFQVILISVKTIFERLQDGYDLVEDVMEV